MASNSEIESKSETVARMLKELDIFIQNLRAHLVCTVYCVHDDSGKSVLVMHCTDQTLNYSITQGIKTLLEIECGEGKFKKVGY